MTILPRKEKYLLFDVKKSALFGCLSSHCVELTQELSTRSVDDRFQMNSVEQVLPTLNLRFNFLEDFPQLIVNDHHFCLLPKLPNLRLVLLIVRNLLSVHIPPVHFLQKLVSLLFFHRVPKFLGLAQVVVSNTHEQVSFIVIVLSVKRHDLDVPADKIIVKLQRIAHE